jgi:tetratricopeptide (TPR) repeat protein
LDTSPAPTAQPFDGQVVVFTGRLSSLGRKDARALVARLGGGTADDVNARTTMLVVGAEGFGPSTDTPDSGGVSSPDASNKLKRVAELNAHRPMPIRVVSEDEFCRIAGLPTSETLRRQYHATRDILARYSSVREDHLRYLAKWGVIRPALRTNAEVFYTFQDVATIRRVNEELESGASFRSVVRNLRASRQGQLELDFRLDAAPARIIALERKQQQPPPTPQAPPRQEDVAKAEEYFRAASEVDDGSDATRDEAAALYRKALEIEPAMVPGLINLANIHYGRNELIEAQALYERAIALEPDYFEAHFNLGNICHDLGRLDEAQRCYSEAVKLNPLYADAHFYLAVTFEKLGMAEQARPHWRAYQQLAPNGEWVELAKEFSD